MKPRVSSIASQAVLNVCSKAGRGVVPVCSTPALGSSMHVDCGVSQSAMQERSLGL